MHLFLVTGFAATCRYCFYSVAKNQYFAPYRKNYELDRKMVDTFYDAHDELYHHAKFGEDRTMRVGCRCENVVFVFCLFVGHAPSPELLSSPVGTEAPKRVAPSSRRQRSSSFLRPTRSHAHRCSRLTHQHGGEQSGLMTLTFDLLTLKVVYESHVT